MVTEINKNIAMVGSYKSTKGVDAARGDKKETAAVENTGTTPKRDEIVKGNDSPPVTYQKPSAPLSAAQLQAMQEQRMNSFTQMLRSMVVRQGETANMTLFGMPLHVTAQDSAKAAAAIAPGGEYSVDAVAGRILDMAKALAGGDESKIDMLRDAVIKGFEAAGVDMGGSLPSICNDTYNKVMEGFDEWKASFDTGAEA